MTEYSVSFDKYDVKRYLGSDILPISFNIFQKHEIKNELLNMDQGKTNSCTANAVSFAYAFDTIKHDDFIMPSRLFIYYNAKKLDGSVDNDNGCEIISALKAISYYGICDESIWPFDVANINIEPSEKCYEIARSSNKVIYARLEIKTNDYLIDLKYAIASGYVIIFALKIYDSFITKTVAITSIVPIPKWDDVEIGYHTMCIIGYCDESRLFVVKNFWSRIWGCDGCLFIPYEYICNRDMIDDFWIIECIRV